MRFMLVHWIKTWLARKKAEPQNSSVMLNPTANGQLADHAEHDVSTTVAYDETLLERAKTQWQLGDWQSLAKLNFDSVRHHPERIKLALLVAAAYQQNNDQSGARYWAQQARQWGCSKKLMSQILIAGVYNSLGKAAAVANQSQRARQHFETAIALAAPQEDKRLLGHARMVRETAKLGLIPQAAVLMDEELASLKRQPLADQGRMRIFETELSLLHHELSLALQRNQLERPTVAMSVHSGIEPARDWAKALKNKSVSQLGQDLWVLEQTGYKRGGFFVEFGATDGVVLSNTYLLEKEFGWRGICAEPNPSFFQQLKENRSCTLSNECIAGETGRNEKFILADAYGSLASYADRDQHKDKRAAYEQACEVIDVTTVSLNDLLEKHHAPLEIDYLSIDTEGNELEILQSLDFRRWRIRLITVEHNFTIARGKIRALLKDKGYRCLECQWDDWYFRDTDGV